MRAWRACLAALALAACGEAGLSPPAPSPEPADEAPQRIVSLDYCADQYVLKFAPRSAILALSPDAAKDFSHMRAAAAGLPRVRPVAEDVLILKPDLVVRAYGGGPGAAALFERAGVPVLEVGWTPDIAAVTANTRRMAAALGNPEAGEAVAARMTRRLAALSPAGPPRRALYVTPGGVTTGPGGLVGEMMERAGLENFETVPGWRPIPLERLARDRPDRIIFADFEGGAGPWSAMRHPLAADQLASLPVTRIEGAWTACGGWFLVDAIEAMAR